MRNQRGGSRTDTLIKLVLIFFISLLSFSVGTFVGKQFSDSKHKLAALESEFENSNRETASVPGDATEVKPEDALSEKDIQKIAEEFVNPESEGHGNEHGEKHDTPEHEDVAAAPHDNAHDDHAEKMEPIREVAAANPAHAAPAPAVHAAPPSAAPEQHAAAPAAERVAHGQAPAEKKPEVKNNLPKELPSGVAASTVGKYTVQVSSHPTKEEAGQQVAQYKGKGLSAFVVEANVKGKAWYRVSIGLFDSKNEATNYRQKLISDSSVTTAIVQQITK